MFRCVPLFCCNGALFFFLFVTTPSFSSFRHWFVVMAHYFCLRCIFIKDLHHWVTFFFVLWLFATQKLKSFLLFWLSLLNLPCVSFLYQHFLLVCCNSDLFWFCLHFHVIITSSSTLFFLPHFPHVFLGFFGLFFIAFSSQFCIFCHMFFLSVFQTQMVRYIFCPAFLCLLYHVCVFYTLTALPLCFWSRTTKNSRTTTRKNACNRYPPTLSTSSFSIP